MLLLLLLNANRKLERELPAFLIPHSCQVISGFDVSEHAKIYNYNIEYCCQCIHKYFSRDHQEQPKASIVILEAGNKNKKIIKN